MAERSRSRDPIYALHFSQAAAEASYLLRVTNEPLVAIRALATIEVEAKKVLAEMVEEARSADHSWAQVAEALGVTRQAAQARFGGGNTGRPKRSKPSE
jgi:hypothetical protein